MSGLTDRFLRAKDLSPEQTWELLGWCATRGGSELTLSFLGADDLSVPFDDALAPRLAPFRLASARREQATAWRATDMASTTALWALTPHSIDVFAELLDEGLFTYPAGDETSGLVEGPVVYRDGRMMLGIVSHEREGILRLTAAEHEEVTALGVRTHPLPEWI